MEKYGYCDLHGHFLPGMDDGSPNVEISLEMLRESYSQGVRKMFATPHYYPVETVDAFLQRREQACAQLQEACTGKQLPQWVAGAEVAYWPGIGYADGIDRLCLGNSRYLLLELPFEKWGSGVLRDVRNLCSTRAIIPILAHLERYMHLQDRKILQELLEQDVLVQCNCAVFGKWGKRSQVSRAMENGIIHLLGSDCHNMKARCPDMCVATAYLQKHNPGALAAAMELGAEIFAQAKGICEK